MRLRDLKSAFCDFVKSEIFKIKPSRSSNQIKNTLVSDCHGLFKWQTKEIVCLFLLKSARGSRARKIMLSLPEETVIFFLFFKSF